MRHVQQSNYKRIIGIAKKTQRQYDIRATRQQIAPERRIRADDHSPVLTSDRRSGERCKRSAIRSWSFPSPRLFCLCLPHCRVFRRVARAPHGSGRRLDIRSLLSGDICRTKLGHASGRKMDTTARMISKRTYLVSQTATSVRCPHVVNTTIASNGQNVPEWPCTAFGQR